MKWVTCGCRFYREGLPATPVHTRVTIERSWMENPVAQRSARLHCAVQPGVDGDDDGKYAGLRILSPRAGTKAQRRASPDRLWHRSGQGRGLAASKKGRFIRGALAAEPGESLCALRPGPTPCNMKNCQRRKKIFASCSQTLRETVRLTPNWARSCTAPIAEAGGEKRSWRRPCD